MRQTKSKLILKGKTAVFIDWANVYGWKKSLKYEIDPKKLYKYLLKYKEIKDIRFYYGADSHPKSIQFLKNVKRTGYNLISKPVKHIFIGIFEGQKLYRRKCDFDMEMCIDAHRLIENNYDSFIFFTGDDDFAPLYGLLIRKKKQVIVVYVKNHIGREIWDIKRGLFKVQIIHLGL